MLHPPHIVLAIPRLSSLFHYSSCLAHLFFPQGHPSQDFLGSIRLTCTDAPASYTFLTPLDDAYQDAGVLAALDGTAFTLDAVFTDVQGTIAEANHTFVLDAP